jgi:hypothetical protein
MRIIAREAGRYRIACPEGHEFTAPRPSISAECPCCGRTEVASALIGLLPGTEPSRDAA